MATIVCECPLGVGGERRVHTPACPNRKRRGKGQQPRDYGTAARVRRDYSQARLAVEHLREVLLRMADLDCGVDRPALSPLTLLIVDCRMQCETVRRYLDGE